MGGEFYDGPPVIPESVVQSGTLDMAVYRGYTNIENKSPGRDVGFLFMLSSRRSKSMAPKIDPSGTPKLVLSLYRPSGKLYATRSALQGDHVVAISVPAADAPEPGFWKFVVEEARGFDGERMVLTAVVGGVYDMYDPGWRAEPNGGYSAIYTPAERPHGLSGGVLRHQLGDGENIGDSRVREVLFGGLIDPDFVEVHRVDSDLVLALRGTRDKVVFRRWFEAPLSFGVRFERDGTVWNRDDIIGRAVTRAPEIIFYVASNDEYITRKAGKNALSGNASNTMFLPGRGDDIVIFGPKGNILYYGRGDGNDTIVVKGGKDSHRAIYFHRDITSRDVSASRNGRDMKISAAGGSITVKGWYDSPNNRIEILNFFAGGTVWDARDAELLAAGKIPVKREVVYTFDERVSP
ncbi:MAG: hypothetical protein LBK91_01175 [Synergistaceae bacterium]|jgi:hypothetical protein|nr:hypothetical protein [Synergistaceae bacterium]